jgi:uncharacterized protein (TIGR00251 family)
MHKSAGCSRGAGRHAIVQHDAAQSTVVGVEQGILHVRLSAPPVEGAANRALLALLAEALALPRAQIALVAGERSRRKRVAVRGLARQELLARLARHIPPDRCEREGGEEREQVSRTNRHA